MKRKVYFLLIMILFFNITSCKKKNEQEKLEDEKVQQEAFNEIEFFSKIDPSKIQSINDIVAGFPSPVEMAATIKDYHIPFAKKYLVDPDITDNYDTNLKKALGLGVLSADLGYLTIYQKKTLMIDYLLAIKKLSDDLKVSKFFDFSTLKYLVLHSDNLDSLQFLSVNSFLSIDEYFRNTNRSHLSLLSVTGVWVESFYLLTQVAKDNPNADLRTKIGSQKELFFQLYEFLKIYKGHPFFDTIIKELSKMKGLFEQVTITEKQGEIEYKVIDGNYTIYQDVETVIEMSDETYKELINTTQKVRNVIVNIK